MSATPRPAPDDFDQYAEQYSRALDQGIAVSGEGQDYFARQRVAWLRRRLLEVGVRARRLLDFGCGTGAATPHFLEQLEPVQVCGVDISERSIAQARRTYPDSRVTFSRLADLPPSGQFDLAFCNGVFHHIPPAERPAALRYVWAALRPDGLFAFCENNPWNPGTHLVMSRIPFDRDAIKISIPESRRLLQACGFSVLSVDTLFYFPRALACLRGLEPALARWPLGAQYMVLARRPADGAVRGSAA